MEISKRAVSQWKKSDKPLKSYQNFIESKSKTGDKFKLEFIDLLYVSNFKGGNATINELDNENFKEKLKAYSAHLREIDKRFGNEKLSNLNKDDFSGLVKIINKISDTCFHPKTKIDGFKMSYLSALLHIYFPNLIPILDRRILLNMNLIKESENALDSQNQVKNIEAYYERLLERMREESKNGKSLREIDGEYFITDLPSWTKK